MLGRHAGGSRVQFRQSAWPRDAGGQLRVPAHGALLDVKVTFVSADKSGPYSVSTRLPIKPVLPKAECHGSSASAGWRQALPSLERPAPVMLLSDSQAPLADNVLSNK
jgi:hypothetical protein